MKLFSKLVLIVLVHDEKIIQTSFLPSLAKFPRHINIIRNPRQQNQEHPERERERLDYLICSLLEYKKLISISAINPGWFAQLDLSVRVKV